MSKPKPKPVEKFLTPEEFCKTSHANYDWLEAHEGFFAPKLPFGHPIHIRDPRMIIWPPADISPTATIGNDVVIGRYTNIMSDVVIGDWCRIQGFCFIPSGVRIGKICFIGPMVCFTNVKYPRVRRREEKDYLETVIEDYVNIGAGAIILPGVKIGRKALIGAGAVVSKDVEPESVVVGVPGERLKCQQ